MVFSNVLISKQNGRIKRVSLNLFLTENNHTFLAEKSLKCLPVTISDEIQKYKGFIQLDTSLRLSHQQ